MVSPSRQVLLPSPIPMTGSFWPSLLFKRGKGLFRTEFILENSVNFLSVTTLRVPDDLIRWYFGLFMKLFIVYSAQNSSKYLAIALAASRLPETTYFL